MKRTWLLVSITLLILFILLDLFLVSGHVEFPWSRLAGFFSLFGFLGCLLIIVLAKLLGHYWLQRKENYYDRDDDRE
ncbi:MAG: hypothetical protein ACE5KP_02130 [Dehalococcoidales bacterium]